MVLPVFPEKVGKVKVHLPQREVDGMRRESQCGGYYDSKKLAGGQKFHRSQCPVVGCGCLHLKYRDMLSCQ